MEKPLGKSAVQDYWERNYPRLSEAVFRILEEPAGHGYRLIAEEEMEELLGEAIEAGLSVDEFLLMCNRAYERPWHDDEDLIYIETEEGDERYNGKFHFFIGPGQLPDDESSINLLRRISRS